jgi:hypothetical protein
MRLLAFGLILLSFQALAASGVRGRVNSDKGCSSPAMMWLSLDKDNYKERLLLMHTEVPVGGSFQFYLKPGKYQLRGSDKSGCEYLKRIVVNEKMGSVDVKLVKK